MLDKREYKYDNMKFILIFLVVFGHIIENTERLNILYLIIYSFHMPVFIFVSGYFSKAKRKSIVKPLCIYLISQTIYFLIYKLALKENISLTYLRPIWILWYIFSLVVWNCIIFLIKQINIKKEIYIYLIIGLAFFASIVCGFFNNIGYDYSLSRIITFFPFFLMGYFSKNNNIKMLKKDAGNNKIKYTIYSVIALFCIIYFLNIPKIDRRWFYSSYSYSSIGYNARFRIVYSLFSLFMIFIFNNFTSNKKLLISHIGRNTVYVYLLHGIIIKIFENYINSILSIDNVLFNVITSVVLTAILIVRN